MTVCETQTKQYYGTERHKATASDKQTSQPDTVTEHNRTQYLITGKAVRPSDKTVTQNENEKKVTNKNLSTEIQRMWKMKYR